LNSMRLARTLPSLTDRLQSRARAHWHEPLHRSTYLFSANVLVTLISGMGFWMLASRLFAPATIGLASAFMAPANYLAILFLLGANYSVLRYASVIEADPSLMFGAIWLSALSSFAGGAAVAAALIYMHIIEPIAGSAGLSVLLYAVLVAGGTVWTVCEAGFVAVRAPWQALARNVGFGGVRIAILLPFSSLGSAGLVAAFTVGTALAALLSIDLLRRYTGAPRSVWLTLWRPGLTGMIRFALPNHLINVITSLPAMLLPLIALATLGADVAGYFAVVWTLVAVLRSILTSASTTLLAEGGRNQKLVSSGLRRSAIFLTTLLTAAALPFLLAPQLVLLPFGQSYSERSAIALWFFALATVCAVPATIFTARERVRGSLRGILLLSIAYCLLTTALPYMGAHLGGFTGFAVGYLVAQTLLSLPLLPLLFRRKTS
jgi:O-antigen/teichoic acid export membrane protein